MDEKICICDDNVVHEGAVARLRGEMPEAAVFRTAAEFFKALGDETRARILWALDRSELCVCDLAELLGMTSSAVSHQLAALRGADLVRWRRDGREVFYSLADGHVRAMLESGIEHTRERKPDGERK